MTRAALSVVALAMMGTLTACGGGPMKTEPAGDALYASAESLYMTYRETTNRVLARVDDGPWQVGEGGYGMTPSGVGCGDGWKFDLTRSTTVETADVPALRQAVAEQLVDEGFDVEGMDLSSETVASGDVIVREQGVYSLLTVTFVDNGNVLVKASTICQPGDRRELRDRIFGTEPLEYGYLPLEEAPTDPLFFGITPGEPRFSPSEEPAG